MASSSRPIKPAGGGDESRWTAVWNQGRWLLKKGPEGRGEATGFHEWGGSAELDTPRRMRVRVSGERCASLARLVPERQTNDLALGIQSGPTEPVRCGAFPD